MSNKQFIKMIVFRVGAELKAEASRYFLGVLWWILEPIIYMGVFYLLFAGGIRGTSQGGDFIVFLLIGLIFWKWFASSVQLGSNSLIANKGIIEQVQVPKWMFPAISFGNSTAKFLFTLVVLLIFLLTYGVTWQITILALPLLIGIQAILALGVSIFLASVVPFIPDLKYLISNAIILMFFLSGVFFSIERFPDNIKKWLYLNPMLTLIESYRDILIYFQWPNWSSIGLIALFAILLFIFSLWHINRLSYTYSKVNRG